MPKENEKKGMIKSWKVKQNHINNNKSPTKAVAFI